MAILHQPSPFHRNTWICCEKESSPLNRGGTASPCPTCDPCRCAHATLWPFHHVVHTLHARVCPFPLEALQTDFSDWSLGSSTEGLRTVQNQPEGPCPNYKGPEAFHEKPRASWINGGVNHCQQHSSVCLGAEWNETFPRVPGKLPPNVDR